MRRNPPAKWTLPLVIHPTTSTSWCVPVPDDPFYRAAFLGALAGLGSAYKWEDDTAHSAKEVARVWQDIADDLQRCMSEPQPITIEEWQDEMSLCDNIRWHNGVLQVLCCGTWQDVSIDGTGPVPGDNTQPSSGTRPGPQESTCFSRPMTARDTFLVPFAVRDGDIVTVTARDGAWSNDGLRWTCTDGTPFALGRCAGDRYHDVADPDPTTLFHGQLMLVVAGQMLSATDGPVTLSGLTGSNQLVVQPNFTPGAGAGGTIQYKICVQNGEAAPVGTWCMELDLTLSSYGIALDLGTFVAGVGINPVDDSSGGIDKRVIEAHIDSAFRTGFNYTSIVAVFNLTLGFYDINSPVEILNIDGVEDPVVEYSSASSGTGETLSKTGSWDSPANIDFFLRSSRGDFSGAVVMTALRLAGNGINPFGSSNC